ncbi:DUF2242 domain-containing protein [Extensimonas vulgaris]|nr:DUF2242 domain-containing protein [Extensimonas vulgaris]
MKSMHYGKKRGMRVGALALALACTACGTRPVYEEEQFKKDSPYQRTYATGEQEACDAALRALLSQGYRIDEAKETTIHAHKEFQPEEELNAVLDFSVICKAADRGATVFVNAIETRYKLKKVSGGASVSVGGGGISLPWSKSADSLVKVSSTTVTEKKFYKQFFDLVASFLPK